INIMGLIISSIGKTIENCNIKYYPVTIAEVVYLCLSVPVIEIIWFIMLFVDVLRRNSGLLFIIYLVMQIPMLMSLVLLVVRKCNLIDTGTKQKQMRSNPNAIMQNPVVNGLYNEFLAPPQNTVQVNPKMPMQKPMPNGIQPNVQMQMQNPVQNSVQQNVQRPTPTSVQTSVQPNVQRPTPTPVPSVNKETPEIQYNSRMTENVGQTTSQGDKPHQTPTPRKESHIDLPYEELDSNGKPIKKPSPPVNLIKK
ncbi:MAG: hypothetical protein II388_05150, partial [Clostridia bacterium]|nr:hypothetical protein [Clostridia bacterium]